MWYKDLCIQWYIGKAQIYEVNGVAKKGHVSKSSAKLICYTRVDKKLL